MGNYFTSKAPQDIISRSMLGTNWDETFMITMPCTKIMTGSWINGKEEERKKGSE